jgi:NAD(P)-dependent dehydrogenase (short-subunit alcohol dehydrogenase family)
MPVSKTALIAGAGPGLGASLARKFAREGCKVGLLARSSDFTKSLAAELKQSGADAVAVSADISNPAQVARGFEHVRRKLGAIDILVNHASAGGPFNRGVLDTPPEDFERAWRVSAYGALLCCQQVVPDMLKRSAGAIFFTGATSSVRGAALAFSSAKFAVRGLAQSLARELWPKGIHVAHIIIDGIIGEPGVREKSARATDEPLLDPDAIADTYWSLVLQDKSAWSLEVDVRPYREKFFE